MKSLLFFIIVFFPVLSLAQQETVISGKLLGADKKPMALAHAHLLKAPNPKPVVQVQTKADGSFEIKTKESGLLVVEFTGVNHLALDVPLLVEKPAKIGMSVSLAAYEYLENPQEIKIMTDIDSFSYDNARAMQKQPDGSFAIDLATSKDKLAYEVVGIEKTGRTINGTQSESYQFDDGGDYRSIVTSHNGKARVVFDPQKVFH